jgi:thiamine biosynthesis lipoprotein
MSAGEREHGFDLFGTRVRILLASDAGNSLDAGLSALRVHARLRGLHRALTRFEPDSELARLNAGAGSPVAVSSTMLRAVDAAVAAARRSDGLVDPTILPEIEGAGYTASRVGLQPAPLTSAIAAAPTRRSAKRRPTAAWERIKIDPLRGTVLLPLGARLDLGGTAKGLAVDLAAEMLAQHSAFAIDAGGDIRLGGTLAPARTVRIDHPLDGRIAHSVMVTEGAVATSGLRTRVWRTAAGYAHHLIDPGRGEPAWTGVIQATALAPTALEAETLAKTALLSGPLGGRDVLARHGGALILDDGELMLLGELEHATIEPVLTA